ncbi:hypothetical protein BD31_I0900 [Candidatus Nitrosopumilus salaria BD31]|uniref:Uncharacterized protein n=1 Tax=Candidatus Nitrosopumilus salarius BD31 TaxID=859350 RepID=I3CZM3_9ARCH|nr:hypothetical protein BD31_I0900 [Candidatus Nitrosopumilus salaria BD31]
MDTAVIGYDTSFMKSLYAREPFLLESIKRFSKSWLNGIKKQSNHNSIESFQKSKNKVF